MITPEMQKAFDDIWGSPTPNTSAQPYNVTRMEELRKIGEEADAKKSAQQDQQRMDSVVGGVAGERYKNVGQDIGQAAYSVFGGGEKMSDIQKQYLDNGNRLLELANKQTDPAMKLKYSKMASEMFSDSGKVPESVIGKVRSGEQVAGDFLGLGTDLALGGGALKGLGVVDTAIKNPILKGAAEGAIQGGAQGGILGAGEGAASSMQNNKSIGGVAKDTAIGGLVGGAGGAVLGGITGAVPPTISKIKGAMTPEQETDKVEKMISPKLTTKEAKLAMSEGRLVKGKEPGLFTRGTPDEVISSDKVMKNAPIIQKNIPGASKMSEDVLADELRMKTKEIAQELKPKMMDVVVRPEVADNASSAWNTLKSSQLEDAPATEEANVAKLQTKFESILNKNLQKDNLTMDDIWTTRQEYDQSIKEAVKKANNMSSESLQLQKDIWLQNRKLLNDIINDTSTGLGETSQGAFKEMTAMYDAMHNIISKAKISTEGAPSKVAQFLGKHKVGVGLVAGGGILGSGLPQKIIKKATGL